MFLVGGSRERTDKSGNVSESNGEEHKNVGRGKVGERHMR